MKAGLVGLGVMGRNLALNLRDAGLAVVATDSWESARAWAAPGIEIAGDHAALAASLHGPRNILIMVKAGEQVDLEIARLVPHLAPGDSIIDGGNSHYRDTQRRGGELAIKGLRFLGVGISGGAEGARYGASLMAGGDHTAWLAARDLLAIVAAKAHDGRPTIEYFGEGGAGHFVKMIHNGIEYAIMQAIAECHGLLREVAGLGPLAIAQTMAGWNRNGEAAGFLMEITAEILAAKDPGSSGGFLLDVISDVAGQKGTGAWSVEAGLEYGVAVPSIMEALAARQVSGDVGTRYAFRGGDVPANPAATPVDLSRDLEAALAATMRASVAQGLQLIATAAGQNGWSARPADIARVWRAGSILRMPMLDDIAAKLDQAEDANSPLAIAAIAADIGAAVPAWRRMVVAAIAAGVPCPVLASSLNYIQQLSSMPLPTALIQAQRDRFGAHGFARTDRDGIHHGPWHDSGAHSDAEAGG